MGSKLGFGEVAMRIKKIERKFLEGGVKLAQQEFKSNFDSESSAESNEVWEDLTYRDVPPPILDLTGELKNQATEGIPEISDGKAVLTIDPIDPKKGKGYADYHEDGIGRNKKREFVTQSASLENKQIELLTELIDMAFTK